MPHFFETVSGDTVNISGENANHIINALRMSVGEKLTLCDDGVDYECEITEICGKTATARVISSKKNESEPSVKVTIYQCVPKGDKLELVIQKAVELGVHKIVPVLSSRCVSRPDEKKAKKKNERYKKIALSACEQSGRGEKVEVGEMLTLKKAADEISSFDKAILFYEGGGQPIKQILADTDKTVCMFIGPEGGFSDEEVSLLCEKGAISATLGKRILRTETAPIAGLCGIMLLTGNLE